MPTARINLETDVRSVVQVLNGVEAGGDVERVMQLPSIPSLQDALPHTPKRRVLPSLDTPAVYMGPQRENTRAGVTDPEAIEVRDWRPHADAGVRDGRVPEREEILLRGDERRVRAR